MEKIEESSRSRRHVAVVLSAGMGHLIPGAELSKRLARDQGVSVIFITLGINPSKSLDDLLSSLTHPITPLTIPPPPLEDLLPSTRIETMICVTVERCLPALCDALTRRRSGLVACVGDLFTFDAVLCASRRLGVPSHLFFTPNLFSLSLILHLPVLAASTTCNYADLPEPLRLPGCRPLHGRDFIDCLQDRSNEAHEWVVKMGRQFPMANGILVNSFEEVEPGALEALMINSPKLPPVRLIGPMIRVTSTIADEDCLKWLDEQPTRSVLFVSFGSGGTLTAAQLAELAFGLESSGHRFLWVVRCPSDKDSSAAFFNSHGGADDDPLTYLPEGFIERTSDVGLVVRSWAPQVEVLGHRSTGGFLSHGGWNSALESVSHGVPMIAWPLYAEQRMNAVMLAESAKVALRPRTAAATEEVVVGSEEIARIIKELMEGEEGKEARHRAQNLQAAAAKAVAAGGAVEKALDEVVDEWIRCMQQV